MFLRPAPVSANANGKVLIRSNTFWLAWYPLRGRRCDIEVSRHENVSANGRYVFMFAIGPLFLLMGPGEPMP